LHRDFTDALYFECRTLMKPVSTVLLPPGRMLRYVTLLCCVCI